MAVIDSTADKFIGKGLIFPITLNSSGRPDIVGGGKLIEASIKSILSFVIGTRYMLGEYGSKVQQLLEEPNDSILETLVKHFTVDVIAKWEKRISVLDVNLIRPDANTINIKINYQIIGTKITDSFIFPYYNQLTY